MRVADENAVAAFGVIHRNGFAQAWAHGVAPDVDLADGPLTGTVRWSGELLGLTPAAARVYGDAEVLVRLSTLRGTAVFDNLEARGVTWGDGDLHYRIAVEGNTFRETGGDAGTLTGIFVGRNHEGAAGTLEREDLAAAFGAER